MDLQTLTLDGAKALKLGNQLFVDPIDFDPFLHDLLGRHGDGSETPEESLRYFSQSRLLSYFMDRFGEGAVYDRWEGKAVPAFPLRVTVRNLQPHIHPIPYLSILLQEIDGPPDGFWPPVFTWPASAGCAAPLD